MRAGANEWTALSIAEARVQTVTAARRLFVGVRGLPAIPARAGKNVASFFDLSSREHQFAVSQCARANL
jgi:hypothetical protein